MDTIAANLANANATRPRRRPLPPPRGGRARGRRRHGRSRRSVRDFGEFDGNVNEPRRGIPRSSACRTLPRRPARSTTATHPDADERGIMRMPNINPVTEIVDLISATARRGLHDALDAMNTFTRALDVLADAGHRWHRRRRVDPMALYRCHAGARASAPSARPATPRHAGTTGARARAPRASRTWWPAAPGRDGDAGRGRHGRADHSRRHGDGHLGGHDRRAEGHHLPADGRRLPRQGDRGVPGHHAVCRSKEAECGVSFTKALDHLARPRGRSCSSSPS